MWMNLLCYYLLTISLVCHANYYDDYDYYEEEDKCSDSPDDSSLACQRWTSCVHCRESVTNCFCDSICSLYADCCPDANTSDANPRITNEQLSCQKEHINRQKVDIYVINQCPNQYNNIDGIGATCSAKKEQGYDLLVLGDESKLIYANMDCCLCHGESSCDFLRDIEILCHDNYTKLPAKAVDSTLDIFYQLLATGSYIDQNNVSCQVNYNQSGITLRECASGLVYTCKGAADNDDAFKCRNQSANFVYEETSGGETMSPPYRNEWCAKCNGIDRYHCKPPRLTAIPPTMKGLSSLVSLSDVCCTQSNFKEEATASICNIYSCPKGNDSVKQQSTTKINPEAILTAVLLSISLVCLLVQLALYCKFKPLRNIPGLILICLSVSLFIAELTFLLSIFLEFVEGLVGSEYCTAIAVLMHYFYLASLVWTNVMAFDVARMLAMPMKSALENSRMIGYCIYAWGCPTVVVVIAVVAKATNLNIQPHYKDNRCWISSPEGLIAYFLGPVFILLATNIVLYIVSIVSIVRAARQTKMVNPNLKERLYLAIKLFFVMGLPWILSIIAAFVNSIALKYIYSSVLSLQGTFLMFCYVFSKTVLNIIKKQESKRGTKSYASGRTSTYSISSRSSGAFSSNKYGRHSPSSKEQEPMTKKRTSSHNSINAVEPQMAVNKTTVV